MRLSKKEKKSEKVHVTIPKGLVGGFEFTVLQTKGKCIPVIISHITFRDCRVHIFFSDNLSPNSCIQNILTDLLQGDVDEQSSAHDTELTGRHSRTNPSSARLSRLLQTLP